MSPAKPDFDGWIVCIQLGTIHMKSGKRVEAMVTGIFESEGDDAARLQWIERIHCSGVQNLVDVSVCNLFGAVTADDFAVDPPSKLLAVALKQAFPRVLGQERAKDEFAAGASGHLALLMTRDHLADGLSNSCGGRGSARDAGLHTDHAADVCTTLA